VRGVGLVTADDRRCLTLRGTAPPPSQVSEGFIT
jgi:hypothetical protein